MCRRCKISPIFGVRYRCMACDNLDFCASCHKKRDHPIDHLFLKIDFPLPLPPGQTYHRRTENLIGEKEQAPVLYPMNVSQVSGGPHLGVSCSSCGVSDFFGVRYLCSHCDNFNLCSDCEADRRYFFFLIFFDCCCCCLLICKNFE